MINQISFQILQKSHVILLNKNFKLEEKYYINKRAHLGTEKNFVLHHSFKNEETGGPDKLRRGGGGVGKY